MNKGKRVNSKYREGGSGPGYSPSICNEICERLASGETLSAICADKHMPGRRTVQGWLRDEALVEFAQRYAHARIDQTAAFVDEALSVARGRMTNKTAYPSKVRIDTLLSVAARMNPAQFSERYNAALVQGDRVLVQNTINLTPPPGTASAKATDVQSIETPDNRALVTRHVPDDPV